MKAAPELIRIEPEMNSDAAPFNTEACKNLITTYNEYYTKNKYTPPWCGYFILRDGVVSGTCGFTGAPSANDTVEIAYWIFKEYEGKGLATDVVQLLINLAKKNLPSVTITAKTEPRSNASTTVLEKFGFNFTGLVQDDEIGDAWFWTLPAE